MIPARKHAHRLWVGGLESLARNLSRRLHMNGRCAGCGGVLGPRFAWRLVGGRAYHRHCLAMKTETSAAA